MSNVGTAQPGKAGTRFLSVLHTIYFFHLEAGAYTYNRSSGLLLPQWARPFPADLAECPVARAQPSVMLVLAHEYYMSHLGSGLFFPLPCQRSVG